MKFLREIANRALRAGLDELSGASSHTAESAYEWARRILAALGLPTPAEVDAAVLRNLARTIGNAIIATEYGAPLRFDHPLVMTLAVADYCPFACANCYADASAAARVKTVPTAMDNYVRIASTNTPFVLLTGGEPLADPGLMGGLKTLLDAGKMVYVATNASIDRYLPLAERNRRRLAFLFSVWGTRERHNDRRGKDSFERVERNCAALAAKGLRANLLVVLADNDLSAFADVGDLARRFSFANIRVTRRLDVGRREAHGLEQTPEFRRDLQREIRSLRAHCRVVFADIPELRLKTRGMSIAQRALGIPGFETCAAGAWMMHIDSAGGAYPCYVFETAGGRARIAPGRSIEDQWMAVRRARRDLPSGGACVGEAAASFDGSSA